MGLHGFQHVVSIERLIRHQVLDLRGRHLDVDCFDSDQPARALKIPNGEVSLSTCTHKIADGCQAAPVFGK